MIKYLSKAWRLSVRAAVRCVEALALFAMIGALVVLVVVTGYELLLWRQTGIWHAAPISALLPPFDSRLGTVADIQKATEPVLRLSATFISLCTVALLFWFREELRLARSRRPLPQPKRGSRHDAPGKTQVIAFRRSSSAARAALIVASCIVFALSIAIAGKVATTGDETCCAPSGPITNSDAAPRVG